MRGVLAMHPAIEEWSAGQRERRGQQETDRNAREQNQIDRDGGALGRRAEVGDIAASDPSRDELRAPGR
jgi:hypothetical protein